MQPHDLKPFSDAVAGVFDALGGRVPGETGLAVWFRTLKGFPLGDVVAVLDDWPARNNRPPTPQGILAGCQDRASNRLEREAATMKSDERAAPAAMGRTAAGRRALRELAAMTAGIQRRRSTGIDVEWARRVIDRYVDADPKLAPIAFTFACDALGMPSDERAQLVAMRETAERRLKAASLSPWRLYDA